MNPYHNNQDKSILDGELERLKGNVNWHTMRQRKLKNTLLHNLDDRTNKHKSFLFILNKVKVPIAAICFISIVSLLLYLTLFEQKNLSKEVNSLQLETSNEVNYPYEITADQNAEINKIKKTGFDLKLPTLSLSADMILTNVLQRNVNGRVEVTTSYQFDRNKEFLIQQDALTPDLKTQYEKRFNEIKLSATDHFLINNLPSYTVETSYDTTVYVLSDNDSYIIHSRHLNTDTLKLLLESMGIE